MKFVNKGDST